MSLLVRMEVAVLPPASLEAIARRHWVAAPTVLAFLSSLVPEKRQGHSHASGAEAAVTRDELWQRLQAAAGGVRAALEEVHREMAAAKVDVIVVPAAQRSVLCLPLLGRVALGVTAFGSCEEDAASGRGWDDLWPAGEDIERMVPMVRAHIEGALTALAHAADALGEPALPERLRSSDTAGRALRYLAVAVAYAVGAVTTRGLGIEVHTLRLAAAVATLRAIVGAVWGQDREAAVESLSVAFRELLFAAAPAGAGQDARREILHAIDALSGPNAGAWRWPAAVGIGRCLGACMDLSRAYAIVEAERSMRQKHVAEE